MTPAELIAQWRDNPLSERVPRAQYSAISIEHGLRG